MSITKFKLLYALLFATFVAVVSMCLASCDDDIESDATPIILAVHVLDSEGNDLLDAANPNNLVGKVNCVITYKDKSHQVFWPGEERIPYPWPNLDNLTRMYAAMFYGVWYDNYNTKGHLKIGEFPGDENWTEHFTLDFPEYNAKFDFELKHKSLDKTKLKVNGKEVKVKDVWPECTIVLP